MTISFADTLRRTIYEIDRLRAIEHAHLTGDARGVEAELAGCDPQELSLLLEQLRERSFIEASGPDAVNWPYWCGRLEVALEYALNDEAIQVALATLEEFRALTASAPGPAHQGSGGTGAQAEAGGRAAGADLTPGERKLVREIESLGEEQNLGGGGGADGNHLMASTAPKQFRCVVDESGGVADDHVTFGHSVKVDRR